MTRPPGDEASASALPAWIETSSQFDDNPGLLLYSDAALEFVYEEPPEHVAALVHFALLRDAATGLPWNVCIRLACRDAAKVMVWLEGFLASCASEAAP